MKPLRPLPESEPASVSPSRWYVVVDNQRLDPIMPGEVYTRIERGVFTRSTLLWHRKKGYCPLGETEFGAAFADAPPSASSPAPASAVAPRRGQAWALAFAPLAVGLGVELCGAWRHMGLAGFAVAMLAANVALAQADVWMLARAGVDVRPLKPAWVVPLYLYRRARTVRHGLAVLGIWIASVVASLALTPLIN